MVHKKFCNVIEKVGEIEKKLITQGMLYKWLYLKMEYTVYPQRAN